MKETLFYACLLNNNSCDGFSLRKFLLNYKTEVSSNKPQTSPTTYQVRNSRLVPRLSEVNHLVLPVNFPFTCSNHNEFLIYPEAR